MNNANSWKFLRFLRLKEEAIKISFLENACKESLDMLECFKQTHGRKLTVTSCNLPIKDSITEQQRQKSFMTDSPMLNQTYYQKLLRPGPMHK